MNIPSKLVQHWADRDIDIELETTNQIIDCLHDIEARLPKPEAPKRWRAEDGGRYWFVDNMGDVLPSKEDSCYYDDFRYKTGNYFASEAEAQQYREQLLANGAQV